MEWKYTLIFLLVLLCLARMEKLYSQNCITMQYDKNGNRISMLVHECGSEYKSRGVYNIINNEIFKYEDNLELLIYPNPNEGKFKIMIENGEEPIVFQIYNINGVMVKNECLSDDYEIDITDNPSGVYLLRVIKGDSVYSRIIVKL